jgi:hypothetical protein
MKNNLEGVQGSKQNKFEQIKEIISFLKNENPQTEKEKEYYFDKYLQLTGYLSKQFIESLNTNSSEGFITTETVNTSEDNVDLDKKELEISQMDIESFRLKIADLLL